MGGVDTSDMMLYSYLDERRAIKYWKKAVFSIFSRMVLNAYILYQQNTDGRIKTRLEFITDIIQSITTEWMAVKRTAHDTPLAEIHKCAPHRRTKTSRKTGKSLRDVQQKGWWSKTKITHNL